MKMQSIYGVILTAVVVTLLVVTVVIPISQTSSNVSYETADNAGHDFLMSKGSSSYSTTIEFVSEVASTSQTFKIGGSNVTVSGSTEYWFVTDGGIVHLAATQSAVMTPGKSTSPGTTALGNESGKVKSVSFSGGTMTATLYNDNTYTSSYSVIFYNDTGGDYGWYSGAFRVSQGEKYYAVATASLRMMAGVGTDASMRQFSASTFDTSRWTVTASEQETYYAVSAVTAVYDEAQYTSGGSTVPATTNNAATVVGCIAPVTYNSAVAQDSITITDTIVSIIPVVLIVGVIVMAVSYVVRRND